MYLIKNGWTDLSAYNKISPLNDHKIIAFLSLDYVLFDQKIYSYICHIFVRRNIKNYLFFVRAVFMTLTSRMCDGVLVSIVESRDGV